MNATVNYNKIGRNELCPICGKKMKKCPGHDKRNWRKGCLIVSGLCSAVVIFFLVINFVSQNNENSTLAAMKESTIQTQVEGLDLSFTSITKSLSPEYFKSRSKNSSWWMETIESVGVPEVEKMNQKKEEINQILNKYAVLLEVAKIKKAFPCFYVTLFDIKETKLALIGSDMIKTLEDSKKCFEVSFAPKKQMAQIGFSPQYFHPWKVLVIPAWKFDVEKYFDALIIHEMVHAYERNSNMTKIEYTKEMSTAEEVKAFTVEFAVLDYATNGQYKSAIQALILEKNETDVHEFFKKIQLSDLQKLDNVVGGEHCNEMVAQIILADHFMFMGLTFIDLNGGSQQEKIQFYDWITAK